MRTIFLAGVVMAGIASTPALAQTATATAPNSNPGGPNQAQQAPSGGTVTPNGAAGGSAIGTPTATEQQAQHDSKKATEICKGC